MGSSEFRASGKQAQLAQLASTYRPPLDEFADVYKFIHQNPELSLHESRTAKLAADHLAKQGFDVLEGIGGHSAVGLLRNGPGKTVLLRADMDALPIQEETTASYASRAQMIHATDGLLKPVMHACGHDMHTTALMAAASCLSAARAHWSGTLICLF